MPLLYLCVTQPSLLYGIHHTHHFPNRSHLSAPSLASPFRFTSKSSTKQFGLLRPKASSTSGAFVGGSQIRRLYEDEEEGNAEAQLFEKLRRWVNRMRSVLPGGSWWDLSEDESEIRVIAEPVTVLRALTRMWELVAQDRWVIFAAFSALIVAAVSEFYLHPDSHMCILLYDVLIFEIKVSTIGERGRFEFDIRLLPFLLCKVYQIDFWQCS